MQILTDFPTHRMKQNKCFIKPHPSTSNPSPWPLGHKASNSNRLLIHAVSEHLGAYSLHSLKLATVKGARKSYDCRLQGYTSAKFGKALVAPVWQSAWKHAPRLSKTLKWLMQNDEAGLTATSTLSWSVENETCCACYVVNVKGSIQPSAPPSPCPPHWEKPGAQQSLAYPSSSLPAFTAVISAGKFDDRWHQVTLSLLLFLFFFSALAVRFSHDTVPGMPEGVCCLEVLLHPNALWTLCWFKLQLSLVLFDFSTSGFNVALFSKEICRQQHCSVFVLIVFQVWSILQRCAGQGIMNSKSQLTTKNVHAQHDISSQSAAVQNCPMKSMQTNSPNRSSRQRKQNKPTLGRLIFQATNHKHPHGLLASPSISYMMLHKLVHVSLIRSHISCKSVSLSLSLLSFCKSP